MNSLIRIVINDFRDKRQCGGPSMSYELDVTPTLQDGKVIGLEKVSLVSGEVWFGDCPMCLADDNPGNRVSAAAWIRAFYKDEIVKAVQKKLRDAEAQQQEALELAVAG